MPSRQPSAGIRSRLTFANVTSCAALFVALGGTGYAAVSLPRNSVGSPQLKANAVNSSKVKNGSLVSADFKPGQLRPGPQGLRGAQGPAGAQGPQGPQGIPLTQYVTLTTAQVDPLAPNEVRAFIPTGSSNAECLLTLAEGAGAGGAGTAAYCGTRNFSGADGVYVHIFLPSPAGAGFVIAVTIYQQNAKSFGAPVLYPTPLQ